MVKRLCPSLDEDSLQQLTNVHSQNGTQFGFLFCSFPRILLTPLLAQIPLFSVATLRWPAGLKHGFRFSVLLSIPRRHLILVLKEPLEISRYLWYFRILGYLKLSWIHFHWLGLRPCFFDVRHTLLNAHDRITGHFLQRFVVRPGLFMLPLPNLVSSAHQFRTENCPNLGTWIHLWCQLCAWFWPKCSKRLVRTVHIAFICLSLEVFEYKRPLGVKHAEDQTHRRGFVRSEAEFCFATCWWWGTQKWHCASWEKCTALAQPFWKPICHQVLGFPLALSLPFFCLSLFLSLSLSLFLSVSLSLSLSFFLSPSSFSLLLTLSPCLNVHVKTFLLDGEHWRPSVFLVETSSSFIFHKSLFFRVVLLPENFEILFGHTPASNPCGTYPSDPWKVRHTPCSPRINPAMVGWFTAGDPSAIFPLKQIASRSVLLKLYVSWHV